MTHEFLADMLGIRRPSVSIAMALLSRAGSISYRRGKVTVLDRTELEKAACECYQVVSNQFDHRFPANPEFARPNVRKTYSSPVPQTAHSEGLDSPARVRA